MAVSRSSRPTPGPAPLLARFGRVLAIGLPLFGAVGTGSGLAADSSTAPAAVGAEAAERRADALFRQLLDAPNDPDLLARFAQAATEAGDLEGAVTAYERLLLSHPGDARVRFELGVLYWTMGATAAAQVYLEGAAASPNLPAPLRAEARRLMSGSPAADDDPAPEPRDQSQDTLTGRVFVGMRYQTNPASATDSDRILSRGLAVPNRTEPPDDVNGLIWVSMTHNRAIGADSATWRSTGSLYASRHVSLDEANLLYGSMTSGPRFRPFDSDPVMVRPYLSLTALMVDDSPYNAEVGGGLELLRAVTERLTVDLTTDVHWQPHYDSDDRRTNAKRSGWEAGVSAEARYALTRAQTMALEVDYTHTFNDKPYYAADRLGLGVKWWAQYTGPFQLAPGSWTTLLKAEWDWKTYGGPHPLIDPDTTRRDQTWRLSASQIVPLTDTLDLHVQANWALVDSNLPNYDRDNIGTMIGVSYRF